MVEQTPQSALARKIAAHARLPSQSIDVAEPIERAMTRALRRAAVPFPGLGLQVKDVEAHLGIALGGLSEMVSGPGLLAGLEDTEGHRGLVWLGHGLVDALIEAQTTGRVDARELPPRPVTQIDEAMCQAFIKRLLDTFAEDADGIAGRDWPLRFTYGSPIADSRQLTLLLPEGAFHSLQATVGFDGAERSAPIVLILPTDPALGRTLRLAAETETPDDPDRAAAWGAARDALLPNLPLTFDAVLMRLTRPLCDVEALQVGDLLTFSERDLDQVRLETADGRTVVKGRLGQFDGARAVRLGAPSSSAPQPQAPSLAAAPPQTAMPEPQFQVATPGAPPPVPQPAEAPVEFEPALAPLEDSFEPMPAMELPDLPALGEP